MDAKLIKFHSPTIDAKFAEYRKILNTTIIPSVDDIYAEMLDEEFPWIEPPCYYDWNNDAGAGWRYVIGFPSIIKGCPRVYCCRD